MALNSLQIGETEKNFKPLRGSISHMHSHTNADRNTVLVGTVVPLRAPVYRILMKQKSVDPKCFMP